ncbi:MAG: hypothetical protein ABI432_05880 [Flavobacteriales bacterium]
MARRASRAPHVRGPVLRVFAAIVGLWLLAMPQVAFSRTMIAFYADIGATPSPIVEEEEVKHACVPSSASALLSAIAGDDDAGEMPRLDERIEVATHGEVDSPPPKVIAG